MLATWRYRNRNSLMDRIDPRARWIFSLCFLFSVTIFWDIRILLVFFVMAFVWYASARTSWSETKQGWRLISVLLLMMILVNTIITSGATAGIVAEAGQHVIWRPQPNINLPLFGWINNFQLTIERVWFGLAQFLRVLSISAVFLIIPYTMDPRSYGFTFHGLGMPDRVAYSLDLAFRYVPTLARDFSSTLDAQRARGYEIERVEGGIITQARKIAPLIVPITMNSILAGEDVTNAMDLRCFGLKKRTWSWITQFKWYDITLIVLSVLMLVLSIAGKFILNLDAFWVPVWILPG